MDTDEITILTKLAAHTQQPLTTALDALTEIQTQINQLAGHTCTGTIWWRDPNSEQPKMYIIHRKDECCPTHGMPDRGKRLRIYIGTDPDRQAEAHAILDAKARLVKLRSRKQGLDRALSVALRYLPDYYNALRYAAPDRWSPDQSFEPDARRPW